MFDGFMTKKNAIALKTQLVVSLVGFPTSFAFWIKLTVAAICEAWRILFKKTFFSGVSNYPQFLRLFQAAQVLSARFDKWRKPRSLRGGSFGATKWLQLGRNFVVNLFWPRRSLSAWGGSCWGAMHSCVYFLLQVCIWGSLFIRRFVRWIWEKM